MNEFSFKQYKWWRFFSKPLIQLFLIIILALILRLYRITNPVLDWHAWRQADTAAVTREFVKHGIDLFRPRYHDLSNIPSGKPNPLGYRMVELPLINGLTALLIQAVPNLDLVITSRFVSVLFSLGTILSLYWLVKQNSSRQIALLSALFLAVMPFSVYYSRVILPEPAFLFFSTLSLAGFTVFLKKDRLIFWLISVLSLAVAFLLKPFVGFLAPVYLTLLLSYQPKFYRNLKIWFYPVIAIAPFIFWRRWIQNFPEGIPASHWLFNSNGIRLRPAWFRWLFLHRLTELILGFIGLIFLFFNFKKKSKDWWILVSWGVGILAYFVVIATGNVRHDYYQVIMLPGLAYALGRGSYYLHRFLTEIFEKKLAQPRFDSLLKKWQKKVSASSQASLFAITDFSSHLATLIVALLIFTQVTISWQYLKGYYQINHPEFQKAGQAADKLLPADAKIIAPAQGDTMFLFQTKRSGWPVGVDIEAKIEQGATHYLTTRYDSVAKELEDRFATVKKTNDYLLLDLTQPKD